MPEIMSDRVFIREVGLRDGLQMANALLASERKLEWARDEAEAGVSEIEVTSFVPPHVIAQFADARQVAVEAQKTVNALTTALVPNLKGASIGFELSVRKLNYVLSASEEHNRANVRRSTSESLADFRKVVEERDRIGLTGTVGLGVGIATAFGCTIQGEVSEDRVVEIAGLVAEAGADEIMVADTVGYANPRQVRRVFERVMKEVGDRPVAAHFHDTRGLGLANVMAAVEAGVRRFDASLGGLGGCPFAPGATGNINTEDCAFLLESVGMPTGIDIDALIALRRRVESWLPGERFSGGIYRSGLPKTFAYSNG